MSAPKRGPPRFRGKFRDGSCQQLLVPATTTTTKIAMAAIKITSRTLVRMTTMFLGNAGIWQP
ncbi:unnamed protein product [Prunus armeniaca]